jgi:hypothetical protein
MSSTAATINTKVYIKPGQQIRRLKVSPDTSFETFRGLILNAYESAPLLQFKDKEYDAQFLYLDDEEDWISINSEQELKDALSFNGSGLFRVQVVIVAKEKKQNQTETKVQLQPWFHHRPLCFQSQKRTQQPAQQQQQLPWFHNRTHCFQSKNRTQRLQQTEVPVEQQPAETVVVNIQESVPLPELEPVDVVVTQIEEPEEQLQEQQHESEKQEEEITQPVIVVEAPTIEDQPFQQELVSLESMGFTNKQLNVHLLNHHKGDMVKVVSQLLELNH